MTDSNASRSENMEIESEVLEIALIISSMDCFLDKGGMYEPRIGKRGCAVDK